MLITGAVTLEEAIHNITRIGCLLGQRTGTYTNGTTRHLSQRWSVSLWKGNAILWLTRLLTVSSWIDGKI